MRVSVLSKVFYFNQYSTITESIMRSNYQQKGMQKNSALIYVITNFTKNVKLPHPPAYKRMRLYPKKWKISRVF